MLTITVECQLCLTELSWACKCNRNVAEKQKKDYKRLKRYKNKIKRIKGRWMPEI